MPHDKLAEVIDAYIANHTPQMSRSATVNSALTKATHHQKSYTSAANLPPDKPDKQEHRCFHCDSRMHLFKHCPYRSQILRESASGHSFTGMRSLNSQTKPRLPANAYVGPARPADSSLVRGNAVQHISNVHCAAVDDLVTGSVHDNLHINDVSPADLCQTAVADAHLMFDCEPCLSDASVSHSIASLLYIDVCIDGVNDVLRGLHDSGAQISVIHPRIVEGLNLPREGTIKLKGLFGDAVDADLVSLFVRLPQSTGISVLMAMSSQVNNDLILADPDKISAMQQMVAPIDKKQVRQVLGFFSYFREYIPHFADIAEPLTALTKKGKPDEFLGAKVRNKPLSS